MKEQLTIFLMSSYNENVSFTFALVNFMRFGIFWHNCAEFLAYFLWDTVYF